MRDINPHLAFLVSFLTSPKKHPQELGFSSFLPRKRGRKGPVKLKGEVLEFALAQKKENPATDPGHLAALIQERSTLFL
jgi:hypothetical protein